MTAHCARPLKTGWAQALSSAISRAVKGSLAPEAGAALSAYLNVKSDLGHTLKRCGSGRELIEWGFELDVEIASELNVSECAPTLVDNAYINQPI